MNPNHIGTNFDDFLKEEGIMTDKQIIIDGMSNFCLVCYYVNKTNELVRIEH